jgi:Fe-S-cluster containining protein
MTPDLVKLRQMAEARAEENFRFRDFLKHRTRLSSEEVDHLVFEIAARVWKKTDCAACANCCREVVPTIGDSGVERLAAHLGMDSSAFASKYLDRAESTADHPWIMRERPCPFLKDNRCAVYQYRPANCRDYPYLDKPDFTARTLSMIERLSVCPAVFEVWEELKRATGFRR